MERKLKVLVTGATGQQGGAVARSLLERGHQVVALTRNASGDAARKLADSGAAIVAGDFETPETLQSAVAGVDTVFLMGNSWETGPEGETRQGVNAVDALAATGVGHVIYSSVASADKATGIPHFDSKYAVEQRLVASGLPYTISAPVAFMDNLVTRGRDALAAGRVALALPPERDLQQIAVDDIGAFVASLAERRAAVFGRRIDIAGDAIGGKDMAAVLSRAGGRHFDFVEIPISAVRQQMPEAAIMFEWFDRVGYNVDIAALRGEFTDVAWHSFDDWARGLDWSLFGGQQAAE